MGTKATHTCRQNVSFSNLLSDTTTHVRKRSSERTHPLKRSHHNDHAPYFSPECLLSGALALAYLAGVSTWRTDKLLSALCPGSQSRAWRPRSTSTSGSWVRLAPSPSWRPELTEARHLRHPRRPGRGSRPPRRRRSRPTGPPPPSPSRYGDRPGPTPPPNASTKKSAAAPTQ